MKDDIAIRVEHVSKDFVLPQERTNSVKTAFVNVFRKKKKTEQHALRDINFEVKKGEFFGVVGRNGSGKSTLLKTIAGIYQPTKGSVKTSGRLVPFIELGVGFNSELTGRENVYLNGALLGLSYSEVDAMYENIVEFAELEGFMDQKLKNYSSGMQVRLAFSVATRSEADILVVDEVLAVGDADFQRKCFRYFRLLKKNNKTVVFVSHDMNAIRDYCDRAILIEDSKIMKSGKVGEVASAYSKLFIDGARSNETVSSNLERKRWGNGNIKFKTPQVTVDDSNHDASKIEVKVEFEVNKDVKKPLFGYTVKNLSGTEMFGTNNKLVHLSSGDFKKGDIGLVRWVAPNILNDGDYTFDLAIVDSETLTEFDWWEDAGNFSVYRAEHTSYVVEPKILMEIKK